MKIHNGVVHFQYLKVFIVLESYIYIIMIMINYVSVIIIKEPIFFIFIFNFSFKFKKKSLLSLIRNQILKLDIADLCFNEIEIDDEYDK